MKDGLKPTGKTLAAGIRRAPRRYIRYVSHDGDNLSGNGLGSSGIPADAINLDEVPF